MNRIKSILQILSFTSLLFPVLAQSHDGWIQVNPIVEKGQPITIALMHGNHSNEHGSFRLAGKWDPQFTKLWVVDPSGKAIDITGAVVDMGEDPEKTGPKGPKGFHLAQFTPREEGFYIVLARQERTLQQDDGQKLTTRRNARSAFAALANPKVSEAQRLKGFDRTYELESLLEILPVTHPMGITQRGSMTMEVLFRGKPAAYKTVTIIGQMASKSSAQDLMTDEKGQVKVSLGPADAYLARVKFDEENRGSSAQLEKRSYEATYVFQVFNH
jgi:hypothetical protein